MILNLKAKHDLVNIQNEDSKIYRVLEVPLLFDLLETKRIGLVAPKLWDDPYEDFLRHVYGMSTEFNGMRVSFERCAEYIFGQCWTFNNETDALWRIYSPNRDRVKIKTTILKLKKSIEKIKTEDFHSYIGKIKYLTEKTIIKKMSSGVKQPAKYLYENDTLIREYYLTKRNTFENEKEVRLIVRLPETKENYKNTIYQNPDNLDICYLPLNNPIELIDEIVFDPRMSDSLVKAYTHYLKNHFGFTKPVCKSSIYTAPVINEIVEKI